MNKYIESGFILGTGGNYNDIKRIEKNGRSAGRFLYHDEWN